MMAEIATREAGSEQVPVAQVFKFAAGDRPWLQKDAISDEQVGMLGSCSCHDSQATE